MERNFAGNYTRMLQEVLNKSWWQPPIKQQQQQHRHLPPITKTIKIRRARHAGHCWRSIGELIRDLLLWIPSHGRAKAGPPARTYRQHLCTDTGCNMENLPRAMDNREECGKGSGWLLTMMMMVYMTSPFVYWEDCPQMTQKVEWSNPEKEVMSSPTARCSSYWKGSFLVALDYGRPTTISIYRLI